MQFIAEQFSDSTPDQLLGDNFYNEKIIIVSVGGGICSQWPKPLKEAKFARKC